MLALYLIIPLFPGIFGEKPANLTAVCQQLKDAHEANGFLTKSERIVFCHQECDFLAVDCDSDADVEIPFVNVTEFIATASASLEKLTSDSNYSDVEQFDDATLEAWMTLFWNLWTILLSVLPVILNQWKYYNFWWAVFFTIVYVCATLLGFQPFWIGLHNIVIALLCLLHNGNSSYLVEATWTMIGMLVPLFLIFFVGRVWHIMILVGSVIGFLLYLHYCFFKKRSGVNAAIFVVFCQLFVMIDQLHFVRSHFAMNTLGSAAVEMMLNCIIPAGRSRYFMVNAAFIARAVASKLAPLNPNLGLYILVFTGLQWVFMFTFRACMGAYYLYTLRYRTDPAVPFVGFVVYGIDLFGPVRAAMRMVFRAEPSNSRRWAYAFVGFFMSVWEFKFAYEFFVMRFLLSFIDSVFVRSRYGRTTHYLEFQLDFLGAAYSHAKSPPWMSINTLRDVSAYVGQIVAKKGDNAVSGIAMVLAPGGKPILYTVAHVVKNCDMISFMKTNVSSPDFRAVNPRGEDPIVAMKIPGFEDAPDISLITRAETASVKQLVFVNRSDDGEYLCVVPEFTCRNSSLSACVNLKKGDSGGPCFATMEDGSLRFCGVVSRGNPRDGGGNLISFVYHVDELSHDSSDEDAELGDVAAFNAVRRRVFASDLASGSRENLYEELRDLVNDIDWTICKDWENKLTSETLRYGNVDTLADGTFPEGVCVNPELYQPRRHPDESEEEGGGGHVPSKSQKGKQRKSYFKDRAARKRAILAALIIKEKLRGIYSDVDARNILDAMLSGNRLELPDRDYVVAPHGSDWIYSDSLPDYHNS